MHITPTQEGLSPFEMIHGRPYRIPLLLNETPVEESERTLAEYMSNLLKQKQINEICSIPEGPIQGEEKIHIGDWVLIKEKVDTEEKEEGHSKIEVLSNTVRFTNLTVEDAIALETGYQEKNEWLEWLRYTVKTLKKENCLVCAGARPHLATVPFPLDYNTDPEGLKCMLRLYNKSYKPEINSTCHTLSLLFPPVQRPQIPPAVATYPGNFTCFALPGNSSAMDLGSLPDDCCAERINKEHGDWVEHDIQRADVWWMCGDKKLRARVPANARGDCAMVQLVMPLRILSEHPWTKSHQRYQRDTSLKGSFDSHIYIDEIGVPRGVPNEFKARNQVTAGFESLFWWVTINKNVDWINYIYYNQQRFVNYTRDAVKGLAEQLGPTSLMAWQNQMALDMILAERGGVCKMFGSMCCTFIPNNTAPGGTVTKALEGLTALSNELAENSGINDPFTNWLEGWFGKWTGLIASCLISIAVALAVLVTCGCCCIPCVRGLSQKVIETAISRTMYQALPTSEETCVDVEVQLNDI
ncbi:uncharacterized protein LOC120935761 [Rana temporaria]|uniref:uncharacterized protein LOC120935761 n=1 Tax=Rana temporaria TaxID=8407 RepID=UPI001AAD8EEE|nr:uncharacterized protein LOC120935761 [Rana temporaria]